MTRLPTNHPVYYNSRSIFTDQNKSHWFVSLSSARPDLSPKFRDWLQAQGCRISEPDGDRLVTDTLGIAPGYHWLEFDNDADATGFVLKYS